jgi:hypothetical protein
VKDGLTPWEVILMNVRKRTAAVERFAAFFAAEIEGDVETADRLAREMVDVDGLDPSLLEYRSQQKRGRSDHRGDSDAKGD